MNHPQNCVAEQVNLIFSPSVLPQPVDTETVGHSPALDYFGLFQPSPLNISKPDLVSETPYVPPVSQCITFSVSQPVQVNGNNVPSTIGKLPKRLGLDAIELIDQVEFCVPRSCTFISVYHAIEVDSCWC